MLTFVTIILLILYFVKKSGVNDNLSFLANEKTKLLEKIDTLNRKLNAANEKEKTLADLQEQSDEAKIKKIVADRKFNKQSIELFIKLEKEAQEKLKINQSSLSKLQNRKILLRVLLGLIILLVIVEIVIGFYIFDILY